MTKLQSTMFVLAYIILVVMRVIMLICVLPYRYGSNNCVSSLVSSILVILCMIAAPYLPFYSGLLYMDVKKGTNLDTYLKSKWCYLSLGDKLFKAFCVVMLMVLFVVDIFLFPQGIKVLLHSNGYQYNGYWIQFTGVIYVCLYFVLKAFQEWYLHKCKQKV